MLFRSTTEKSLSILGVKKENILFNETVNATELHVNADIISELQRIILKNNITDIFTHMEKDTYHQDHIATHFISMAASRRYINNIFCFETIFNFSDGLMVPNIYIDVSDTIEKKFESLRLHKTEYEKFDKEKWIESVKSLAILRGCQISRPYAESFNVKKMIIDYESILFE